MKKTTKRAAEKKYQEMVIQIPKPVLYLKYIDVAELLSKHSSKLVSELDRLDMYEYEKPKSPYSPPTFGGD